MVVLPLHIVNHGFTMVNHMVELPYPKNHGSTMVFLVGLSVIVSGMQHARLQYQYFSLITVCLQFNYLGLLAIFIFVFNLYVALCKALIC